MLTKQIKIDAKSTDVELLDSEFICENLEEEFLKMSGKDILLTGGAGFLGFYIIKSILLWNELNPDKKNINLRIFDNFSRGVPIWIKDLPESKSLSIQEHDITKELPENIGNIDFIIHAASIASPIYYRLNPIQTMDANVGGLRKLLDYCLNQKNLGKPVSGFLFFSTSEIYGDPDKLNIPTSEEYRGNVSCTGPRACYDESKRFGETLCVNFAKQYNLPVSIARPFNNYGPGLKITDGRVLPDFVRNVLANEDIELLSDGSPTRTFCYVADAVIGYFKILINGAPGESYNIGNEEPEISMLDLANNIANLSNEVLGYDGKVTKAISQDKNYLIDNPNRRCPIIKKAHDELGFLPKVSIEEGLKRSLIWYKTNNAGEDL
jgi:nucleoside-diphosphate-sugar epimerase